MKKAICLLGFLVIFMLATGCIYSSELKGVDGKYVLTYFLDDDDIITTAGIEFETVNEILKATYFDTYNPDYSDISDVVVEDGYMVVTFTVDGHRYYLKKNGNKLEGYFFVVIDGEEVLESKIDVVFEKK